MKIVEKVKKFQQGGPMPAAGDPMAQLMQVAAEAVQTQNCEAAMAVCQALLQLAQGEGPAPEEAPMEEPTFARHGARLVKVK